jgi:TP901 family phage tail tape measure protein
VDLATKFQSMTTQFETQANVGVAATDKLRKGILDMAGAVGQTPDELAGGMYHIVSSMNNLIPSVGRARTELGILRIAAEGATVGGSNLTQTTYVLSSLMNALGQTTIPQAHKSMAMLNAIVGAGDMHMQDLMNALSTGIVPTARNFGISMQSVGAALDVLTDKGQPAQRAATLLRTALVEMAAPPKMAAGILEQIGLTPTQALSASAQMSALLEKAGVSTTRVADDLRKPDGVLVALRDLQKHMEASGLSASGAAAVISRSFGGIRGATIVENLFQSQDKLQGKYEQLGQTASRFNTDVTKAYGTLGVQFHQFEGAAESLGVRLGDVLIPEVEKVIDDGKEVFHWFTENKTAAEALAAVIGGVLVASVVALGVNVARRIGGAVKTFAEFGKSVASFPFQMANKLDAYAGGGGAATAAAGTSAGTSALGWGYKSFVGPGSIENPLAVMVVAGPGGVPFTPAGVAATAEETAATDATVARTSAMPAATAASATGAEEAALLTPGFARVNSGLLVPESVAAERAALPAAEAAGGAGVEGIVGAETTGGISALGRSALGGLAGGAATLLRAGTSAGMAYAATQILGQLLPGQLGKTVGGLGAGSALGAVAGTVLSGGNPIIGAVVGMATQAILKGLGSTQTASGEGTDIAAGAAVPIRGGANLGQRVIGGSVGRAVGAGLGAALLPVTIPVAATMGLYEGSAGGGAQQDAALKAQAKKATSDLAKGLWTQAIHEAELARVTSSDSDTPAQHQMGKWVHGVAIAAVEGEGRSAAKSWTDAFMKGLSGYDAATPDTRASMVQRQTTALAAGIKQQLDDLTPTGRLSLAQAMDSWAQQMQQKNPAVKKPMDDLQAGITQDMHTLGSNIKVVNGQVLDGSTQQWSQISTAISNPIDRAQAKLAGDFATMKSEALGALEAMGYSPAQASKYVSQLSSSKSTNTGLPAKPGSPGLVAKAGSTNYVGLAPPSAATGMRVPGAISGDTWSILDPSGNVAGFVGGGELLIANRHTEARASAATMAAYGKTLGQLVAGETSAHMAPGYATGGNIFAGVGVKTSSAAGGIAGALVNSPLIKELMALLSGMNSLGGGGGAVPGGMGTAPSVNQQIGRRMMISAGWPASQWPYLNALWTRESGWSDTAVNPTSGAAGIAQSLGHGPVALGDAAGQIAWGLGYIRQRYGSPGAAWGHEEADGWYAKGGRPKWGGWHAAGGEFTYDRPTLIGVGDVPETVSISPASGSSSTGRGDVIVQVTIQNIEWKRPGDLHREVRAAVEAELRQLASEIAEEHERVSLESELSLLR